MRTVETSGDMIYEADYAVKMNDGITIRYDVYRPKKEGSFPAIVTYGPYSKGNPQGADTGGSERSHYLADGFQCSANRMCCAE